MDWFGTKATEADQSATPERAAKWDTTLFADDVKIQSKDETTLYMLISASESWATNFGMEWNVGKCTVLWRGCTRSTPHLMMNGQIIKNDSQAEYLGISVDAAGTKAAANAKRLKGTTALLHTLKRNGVHGETVTTHTLLQIWSTYILPRATYSLHLVPQSAELEKECESLKKR